MRINYDGGLVAFGCFNVTYEMANRLLFTELLAMDNKLSALKCSQHNRQPPEPVPKLNALRKRQVIAS